VNRRPRERCFMKKTGVQKSCETVPLNTAELSWMEKIYLGQFHWSSGLPVCFPS
jgi:hypothetical protein